MMFIDKEKLDALFVRQKRRVRRYSTRTYAITLTAVIIIMICILGNFEHSLLVSFAVAIAGIAMILLNTKLMMSKSESFGIDAICGEIQRDYASDHIYAKAYTAMSEEHRPIKKQRLILIASEICSTMGNIPNALNMIYSADTKVMAAQDPELLMIYYHDLMYYYFQAEDMESVRKIYSDTAAVIEEYAKAKHPRWDVLASMNFYRCIAEGDYAQALSQRLAINDYKNNMRSIERRSPFAVFRSGQVFYETAQAYFYAGDRQNALQCLDMAAPAFSRDPYWLGRANALAAQIQGTDNVQ